MKMHRNGLEQVLPHLNNARMLQTHRAARKDRSSQPHKALKTSTKKELTVDSDDQMLSLRPRVFLIDAVLLSAPTSLLAHWPFNLPAP